MALSTSSSSASYRLQAMPWHRLFLRGFLLFLAGVIAFEAFWRAQGFRPQIKNDYALWKHTFVEALENDSKAVVLVGASRVMQGIQMATLNAALPKRYRAYQLANSSASPLPTLGLLANHTQFSGTVLIDVTPRILFGNSEWKELYWVRKFAREVDTIRVAADPFYKPLQVELKTLIERNLLIAGWQLSPRVFIRALKSRSLPKPRHYWFLPDRTQMMDYSSINQVAVRQNKIWTTANTEVLTATEHAKMQRELARHIETIRRRGGKALFVRMPSEGRLREIEQEKFPREAYWEDLLVRTHSVGIHFEDHPTLQGYNCTDASHIDSELAPQFTLAFAEILRGYLIDSGSSATLAYPFSKSRNKAFRPDRVRVVRGGR